MNSLLNKYAPLQKVNKYKIRFKIKPWAASVIQISIYIKNKKLNKFINENDPEIKAEFQCRVELSAVIGRLMSKCLEAAGSGKEELNTLLRENNALQQTTRNKSMRSQFSASSEIGFQNGW